MENLKPGNNGEHDRLSRLLKKDELKQTEKAEKPLDLASLEAEVAARLGGGVKVKHEQKKTWEEMRAMEEARGVINFRETGEAPLPQRRTGEKLSKGAQKAASKLFRTPGSSREQ